MKNEYPPCLSLRSKHLNCAIFPHAYVMLSGFWLVVGSNQHVTQGAVPLTSQYEVNVSTVQVGTNEYRFEYDIFNLTDQIGSSFTGLDALYISIPQDSTISDISMPPPYFGAPGYWAASFNSIGPSGFDPNGSYPGTWLQAYGYDVHSVYPIGSEAVVSFVANNCVVGKETAGIVTFWNQIAPSEPYVTHSPFNYTLYTTTLAGPVAVPELTVPGGITYPINATNGPSITVVTYAGITINPGGTLIVDPASTHSSRQLLVVTAPGLSIAGTTGNWTGLLDLSNNDMDLPCDSLATVTDQIRQGYNNGNWNATGGIISSSAASDSSHLTALGVIQNNQSGSPLFTTFDTYAVGASDILVKYTYYGDANLDGKVDGSDYSLIDNGYLQHLTGWFNGDFNYDGVIDGSDYTLIDNAFNTQGASLEAVVNPPANVTAEISVAAVPEPAALPAIAVAALAKLGRRRNRSRTAAPFCS